ncbi:MAG: hypothetical protein Q7S30_03880 [Candidatus Omnitrophota bacterium]|nr:hypothetical protein [Candidatus Omnitrophota bacterium]
MRDKKIVALIVLIILAVISLIYGVTASPKGRVKSTAVAGKQLAIASVRSVTTNVLSIGRHAKRSQFRIWKRNPFVSGMAPMSANTQLALNGIIWDKTKPKAMIGDAIVVKGDTIGSNKVVDILQDRVILNDGTKEFELKLEK